MSAIKSFARENAGLFIAVAMFRDDNAAQIGLSTDHSNDLITWNYNNVACQE